MLKLVTDDKFMIFDIEGHSKSKDYHLPYSSNGFKDM